MPNIQSISTPDGTVTITSGLPVAPEPSLEAEGPATILRVGGLEILVDPAHCETPTSDEG